MLESSFNYIDCNNNEIVVTLEYVDYPDMKYTVIYCSAYNTIYQYLNKNYIEAKQEYKRLLNYILMVGKTPCMVDYGFTIVNEIPF